MHYHDTEAEYQEFKKHMPKFSGNLDELLENERRKAFSAGWYAGREALYNQSASILKAKLNEVKKDTNHT